MSVCHNLSLLTLWLYVSFGCHTFCSDVWKYFKTNSLSFSLLHVLGPWQFEQKKRNYLFLFHTEGIWSSISSAKFLLFFKKSLLLNWSANAWIQLQSLLVRNGSVGPLERGSVKQGSGQPSLSVHERSITPRRRGIGGTFFNLTFILCLDYIRGGFQHT